MKRIIQCHARFKVPCHANIRALGPVGLKQVCVSNSKIDYRVVQPSLSEKYDNINVMNNKNTYDSKYQFRSGYKFLAQSVLHVKRI